MDAPSESNSGSGSAYLSALVPKCLRAYFLSSSFISSSSSSTSSSSSNTSLFENSAGRPLPLPRPRARKYLPSPPRDLPLPLPLPIGDALESLDSISRAKRVQLKLGVEQPGLPKADSDYVRKRQQDFQLKRMPPIADQAHQVIGSLLTRRSVWAVRHSHSHKTLLATTINYTYDYCRKEYGIHEYFLV